MLQAQAIQPYSGNRKSGASLRASLISQGVSGEWAIRFHLTLYLMFHSLYGGDVTQYKVNPNYPNRL